MSKTYQAMKRKVQTRILVLFRSWVKLYPQDFNGEILETLTKFLITSLFEFMALKYVLSSILTIVK